MSNPSRKMIEVYEMLKDGKPFAFDKFVSRLGCKPVSAMVLICALRRDFKADIETIRDGRKVEAYQLHNAAELAPKMVGKTKTSKAKAPTVVKSTKVSRVAVSKSAAVEDGSVPTLDRDLEIAEIDDRELADLKSQLGLA